MADEKKTRKSNTFTDAENAALHAAFIDLHERNKWSQAEAGRQIGVGQQAASYLLKGGKWGLGTATRLAALLDYDSAHAFLRDRGATPNPMTVPQEWAMRDLAITLARRIGYKEEVLRRVVMRFQESQYFNRPARWWNDRIVATAAEMEALGELPQTKGLPSESPPKMVAKKARKAS